MENDDPLCGSFVPLWKMMIPYGKWWSLIWIVCPFMENDDPLGWNVCSVTYRIVCPSLRGFEILFFSKKFWGAECLSKFNFWRVEGSDSYHLGMNYCHYIYSYQTWIRSTPTAFISKDKQYAKIQQNCWVAGKYIYICICIYVYIYVCIYVYICIYIDR